MDNFSIDAYTPKQIAARVEQACVSKANNHMPTIFVLAILAGAFIGLGGAFFIGVTFDATGISRGLLSLVGGIVFSLGLILVIVAGAELFTGNNLLVMALMAGKITAAQLLKNWLIVYIGNFVGAVGLAVLMVLSGVWWLHDGAVAAKVLAIADAKLALSPVEAFFRGVLCNMLVCLAVWLCFAGRSVTDKVVSIILPVAAFVALGFEHSVANMFFVPAAMLVDGLAPASTIALLNSPDIFFSDFLLDNLLPVTLGNIVGGAVLVGLVYWFNYIKPRP
jgi:formate transporter